MTAIDKYGAIIQIEPSQIRDYLDAGWVIGDDHAFAVADPESYIPKNEPSEISTVSIDLKAFEGEILPSKIIELESRIAKIEEAISNV